MIFLLLGKVQLICPNGTFAVSAGFVKNSPYSERPNHIGSKIRILSLRCSYSKVQRVLFWYFVCHPNSRGNILRRTSWMVYNRQLIPS